MATYTAAAGGGNWNVAATWGGLGVPTTGDTAILNATSGPVTVTATALCTVLDMSSYANTLTINNGLVLQVSGTGATISLGGTINPTTTGELSTRALAPLSQSITINFNGVTIPRLFIGYIAGAGAQTITINGVNPTVENLRSINGVSGSAILAGTALNITSSLFLGLGANGTGLGAISGVPFNITGGGIVDVTCFNGGASEITGGFTVVAGTTLRMLSNLEIGAGVVTFQAGSFLSNASNFTLVLTAAISATLDTSAVTWYNVSHASSTIFLTSDINISNNLTMSSTANCNFTGSGGTRNINIQGNFSLTAPILVNMTNTIINLNGTGIWDANNSTLGNTTVNINGSGLYTIGSATRNSLILSNTVVNLGLTSSATVNTNFTVGILLTASVINTNNTSLGGSQILWWNLNLGTNTTVTLSQETIFQGNLTFTGTGTGTIQGAKLLLYGNLTHSSSNQLITGTSTIEFAGSNNVFWGTTGFTSAFQNNITINKSGGAVTLRGTVSWGLTGRTLLLSSGSSTIDPGTSTVVIPLTQSVTISNMIFNNLTLNGNNTITQNALNTINSTLLLSGSTTFSGAYGFTTQNFTCVTPNSTITLQNINANPLAEYRINGVLTLLGTSANRIALIAAGSAPFNGTITPVGQLNYLSGTIPSVGMTVSQATGVSPAGLIGLLPNRPVITGGTSPTFTISPSATATIGSSLAMRAGYKAKFILTNNGTSSQNVAYVTTNDIDSSDGVTILSFGSNGDDVNNSTVALFRTLNWGPLVAPSGSVYYTFVN